MTETPPPGPAGGQMVRVELQFLPPDHPGLPGVAVQEDLSACVRLGDVLFLACDETAGIERLRLTPAGWGDHHHYDLAGFVDLPAGPGDEIDIEGLEVADGWLWVLGSHALKRRGAGEAGGAEALARMAEIRSDGNRQFLGRLPLADMGDGPEPVAQDGARRQAHVKFARTARLKHWLEGDAHLGPFLGIPAKENGLDIEGIAVRGDRVWLGLRGPVLRGHAMVLEVQMGLDRQGHLKPARIDGRRRYRKHLIDTGGAGIRDLALDGDDLLLLTGPTLAGDGSTRVLRWKGAVGCTASGLHGGASVTCALDLPYGDAGDNPEGLCRWDATRWLVIHDSPHPERISGRTATYQADLWVLQG